MKVVQLLEQRRTQWEELDALCQRLEGKRKLPPDEMLRFGTLYRAACADLALADAYQLPTNTIQYLHLLVGRAHNQFYRSRKFNLHVWTDLLFRQAPQRIFNDGCVQFASVMFWFVFLASAFIAYSRAQWPDYAEDILSRAGIEQLEESFAEPLDGRNPSAGLAAAGFYINHNTGIGLKCFASALLVIPGLLVTTFNAAYLGAAFGYMARPEITQGDNFLHFVTAHGPFELTAIVLSFGAGLRIGMSWIMTHGLTRTASLRKTGAEAMPIMGAAMILFTLAAFIEGFVSPSSLPYMAKAMVAMSSSGALMFYFVVLGFPQRNGTVARAHAPVWPARSPT